MVRLVALSHIVIALVATSPAQKNHTERVPSNRALAWAVSLKVFGRHAREAFCIAGFETGHTYSPTAVSRTNDHGEWQIHDGLRTYGRQIYNIWFNAHVAYRMSRGGTDWHDWTTHSYCGV